MAKNASQHHVDQAEKLAESFTSEKETRFDDPELGMEVVGAFIKLQSVGSASLQKLKITIRWVDGSLVITISRA